ncbi:hypothetical protein F6S87_02280 [Bifidobacterium sp. BRDM6]|uniref:Molecular chaperone DnaJ n=2 Tax=Bifidobacterium choloepi TaxID=2614131 RepID=A0A6I5MYW1_9BIFI|nr:hypothetical protein [Bifidobacterium choloepi]
MTHDELLATLEQCRGTLADALATYDQIRQQALPQVRADYALKIGVWETRLVETSLEAAREKRRFALLQTLVNQGSTLDEHHLRAVEAQLVAEYQQWIESLEQQRKILTQLLDQRAESSMLKPDDARKVNKLFRTLARRLHPDLHPGDARRAEYYRMAQAALANGDLTALESLVVLTASQADDPDYGTFSDDELAHEIEMMQAKIEELGHRVDELLNTPPLAYREQLGDPAWIEERTAGLKSSVAAYERQRDHYRERIAALKKGQS